MMICSRILKILKFEGFRVGKKESSNLKEVSEMQRRKKVLQVIFTQASFSQFESKCVNK